MIKSGFVSQNALNREKVHHDIKPSELGGEEGSPVTKHRNAKNDLHNSQWLFIVFKNDSSLKQLAIKGNISYPIMALGPNSVANITFIQEY